VKNRDWAEASEIKKIGRKEEEDRLVRERREAKDRQKGAAERKNWEENK
jgi:hypothetical protein